MVLDIVIATVCLENVYAARRPLRQSSSVFSDTWMYVAKQLMRAWDPVMKFGNHHPRYPETLPNPRAAYILVRRSIDQPALRALRNSLVL
jgi:hypothetical protein